MHKRIYPLFSVICLVVFLLAACDHSALETEPKIAIKPDSLVIEKVLWLSWILTVTADDVELDSTEVNWKSNNPRVATVNGKGYVTAVGAGKTEIIATLVNGKGSATCKVTVFDTNDYKFRLVLKDKGTSDFSFERPEEFLSSKAIERRKKQNIPIDETDLPISTEYLKEIEKIGGVIVAKSKWLKTVTIHCSDEFLIDKYKELPFVEDVVMVWHGKRNVVASANLNFESQRASSGKNVNVMDSIYYGSAWNNINLLKGQALHELGYKGAGMDIAVIDEGFIDLKNNPALNNITIKGAKSFIYENSDPYTTDSHGVWVLSCMATNKPGFYVGTAPEANYWLLRTEVASSEYPVEEDYWVAAAEFADSVGVHMINTSLTYYFHDGDTFNYKWQDMDGKTAFASRGANVAAAKGIFIVCCAGNSGTWVGAPADSPNVLTVGSVNKTGKIDDFTSYGMTVDGRMKPDVVALGGGVYVINIDGKLSFRSGTSYSSPTLCGLAACLWQAYPQLTNKALLELIRKSADKYDNPNLPYGCGIPNMQKAMQLVQQ